LFTSSAQKLVVDELARQRCSWCGALVEERDFTHMAVAIQPGESPKQAAEATRQMRREPGAHVAVDGNVRYVVPQEEGRIPDGSCRLFDPFATS